MSLDKIYRLLEAEIGLTSEESDKYFAITRNDKEFVLKLRSGAWLEGGTREAMQKLAEKTGGHFDGKGQIFVIPVDFEPKTPEVPCVDNGVCDKKPLGAEPPPRRSIIQ